MSALTTTHPGAAVGEGFARRIRELDFYRRSPSRFGLPAEHKEWQHFIVHGEDLQLIVNFNLLDDLWSESRKGEVARLIVLLAERQPGGSRAWRGDVQSFEPSEIEVDAGGIEARFGRNAMRFSGGAYQLSLDVEGLRGEIELVPMVEAEKIANLPLTPGRPIHWVVVPRLEASARVALRSEDGSEREVSFDGALAYHDHNWGHFRWGDDFTWEWGSALPKRNASPWSLLFVRSSDRGRRKTRCQLLQVWRGNERQRLFLEDRIQVEPTGRFEAPQRLRVPRIMGLAADENACDVPERYRVEAESEGDWLRFEFVTRELSQIIIPNETDLCGVTTVNEAAGETTLEGEILGESFRMEGHGVFEFVR